MDQLIEQITFKTIGILWITKVELNRKLKYFEQLNYLFDGLLVKSSQDKIASSKPTPEHFFIGTSFGHPLMLIHLEAGEKKISENIFTDAMKLFQSNADENNNEILIIDECNNTKLLEKVSSQFSQFTFKYY